MSNQSFVDVETQTAEVEAVHRLPLEIFPKCTEDLALTDTESHNTEGDVAEDPEDQDHREENLPGIDIEFIQTVPEQTDEDVVGNCVEEASTDGIICNKNISTGFKLR